MYSEYRTDESKPPKRDPLDTNTHALRGVVGQGGRHIRKWCPGTQALHEIQHYQRTTELCIPSQLFVW